MCKPEEGEPFVQRGLKLINEVYGEDSIKLVEPLNVLGLIEIDKENYSEAATVLKKLRILEKSTSLKMTL